MNGSWKNIDSSLYASIVDEDKYRLENSFLVVDLNNVFYVKIMRKGGNQSGDGVESGEDMVVEETVMAVTVC